MSIEHARKHGPFDSRYPPIRHRPAPASPWRLGEERADWQGFLARFYPGCRRHDFHALAAYESYLNDVEGCRPGAFPMPGSLPAAVHAAQADKARGWGDEEEQQAAAETARWEGEGGSVMGRLRRPRRGSDVSRAHRV